LGFWAGWVGVFFGASSVEKALSGAH